MSSNPIDLMTPRVLVLDDERQIHASLKLRLGPDYELVSCFNAHDALEAIAREQFDLCFVDIHMPKMDGLSFIEAARRVDEELGYVIISAFDTDENLRRAIPLQVYEFISKPLPDRDGFEARVPEWVARTRQNRRSHHLAEHTHAIANDRDSARLELEIEFVASEAARDALLQTAGLLTTVHAHLVSAASLTATRTQSDSNMAQLLRSLEQAKRMADAAMTAAQSFFETAYGNRDSSPALVNDGVREAISIASRVSHANDANKVVDFRSVDVSLPLYRLSGIEFLLMMVPVLAVALIMAPANTTVRVNGEQVARLDKAIRDPRLSSHLWTNRRNVLGSRSAVLLTVTTSAPPLAKPQVEAWLRGDYPPLSALAQRGLMMGIDKCQGAVGFSTLPAARQFQIVLALPV